MEGVLDVTLPHDAEVTHHLKRREDRGCTGKWEREGGRGGTGEGRQYSRDSGWRAYWMLHSPTMPK